MLIFLKIKSLARFLIAGIAQYLVIAISAAALFGVFFYIFRDFTLEVLADMGLSVRRNFAFCIVLGFAFRMAWQLRQQYSRASKDEILQFAATHGCPDQDVFRYRLFLRVLPLFLYSALLAGLLALFSSLFSFGECAAVFFGFILLSFTPNIRVASRPREQFRTLAVEFLGPIARWRLLQILVAKPYAKVFAALLVFVAFLLGIAPLPHPFLRDFLCFVLGIGVATVLLKQIAVDFGFPWLEMNSGLSEERYLQGVRNVAVSLTMPLLLALLVGIVGRLLMSSAAFSRMDLLLLFLPACCLALPVIAIPAFVFQIDPRRVDLNLLIVFLVSLFLCSGMVLQPLVVFLVPVVLYYANVMQKGRFYRAGSSA